MSQKIRPGASMYAILWMAVIAVVLLSAMAHFAMKSDPNYSKARVLNALLSSRLNAKHVNVIYAGGPSRQPQDKLIKVTLLMSKAQYEDEIGRSAEIARAADMVMQNADFEAASVRVTAKTQTRGGCQPVYTQTVKEFIMPGYEPVKPKPKKPKATDAMPEAPESNPK